MQHNILKYRVLKFYEFPIALATISSVIYIYLQQLSITSYFQSSHHGSQFSQLMPYIYIPPTTLKHVILLVISPISQLMSPNLRCLVTSFKLNDSHASKCYPSHGCELIERGSFFIHKLIYTDRQIMMHVSVVSDEIM